MYDWPKFFIMFLNSNPVGPAVGAVANSPHVCREQEEEGRWVDRIALLKRDGFA
jgi:hypothetical protein